jgi:hypothetical protein
MVSSGYSQNGTAVLRRRDLVMMVDYCSFVFGEGGTSLNGRK